MADERPPRNPFRNEADAFRVLMMVVGAGALVVALTLLVGPEVGIPAAMVLIAIGLWRTVGLIQDWRKRGTGVDPPQD